MCGTAVALLLLDQGNDKNNVICFLYIKELGTFENFKRTQDTTGVP